MSDNIRIGISSCLMGNNVRYNGGHKLDCFSKDTFGQFVDYIPVCPEREWGLGIPREAMRLVGQPEFPRLLTYKTNIDHTEQIMKWSPKKSGGWKIKIFAALFLNAAPRAAEWIGWTYMRKKDPQ